MLGGIVSALSRVVPPFPIARFLGPLAVIDLLP